MESIIFAGTPDVSAAVLRGLSHQGVEIALVLTKQDVPIGRKREISESAVAKEAKLLGLPVLKTDHIDANALDAITQSGAKLGVIVAYGSILGESALRALDSGWYNLHFSLLPKYRGAAPVQRALLNGESVTGVSLFKLDAGVDTGLMAASLQTEIAPDENSADLLGRLGLLGLTLLLQELPKLGTALAQLQPQIGETSSAPKLSREDARINFSDSALVSHNRIRACNPEPGAWAKSSVGEIKIHASRVRTGFRLAPGELCFENSQALVGCGDGSALELIEVQPAGRKRMTGTDWLRGAQGTKSLS